MQYRNTAEILRYRFSGGFSAHVSASQSASAVKSRKYKCRETERIKAQLEMEMEVDELAKITPEQQEKLDDLTMEIAFIGIQAQ